MRGIRRRTAKTVSHEHPVTVFVFIRGNIVTHLSFGQVFSWSLLQLLMSVLRTMLAQPNLAKPPSNPSSPPTPLSSPPPTPLSSPQGTPNPVPNALIASGTPNPVPNAPIASGTLNPVLNASIASGTPNPVPNALNAPPVPTGLTTRFSTNAQFKSFMVKVNLLLYNTLTILMVVYARKEKAEKETTAESAVMYIAWLMYLEFGVLDAWNRAMNPGDRVYGEISILSGLILIWSLLDILVGDDSYLIWVYCGTGGLSTSPYILPHVSRFINAIMDWFANCSPNGVVNWLFPLIGI
ncbi:unnamed protein product [Arabis nemorensis]|uniref:Uncharacterized protein n=1 Tax=Arabis nemorensis TaxID=586526 RepID=A0A565AP18_9BRAS|nr:unnamed protein product [Arabis nemorensis]